MFHLFKWVEKNIKLNTLNFLENYPALKSEMILWFDSGKHLLPLS